MKNDKLSESFSSDELDNSSDVYSECYERGISYLKDSKIELAKSEFESILEENLSHVPAHFGLGCVFAFKGLMNEACREWNEAINIEPDFGKAHYALSWAFYGEGDLTRGCKYANKALELGVDLAAVREIFRVNREGVPERRKLEVEKQVSSDSEMQGYEKEALVEAENIYEVKEETVKIDLLQRITGLFSNKERFLDVLNCLMILIVCFLLLRGTFHDGFPRDHLDATMAYYIAKVRMLLDKFEIYTTSWYFGYELLRFYPPLSTLLPYIVAIVSGNLNFTFYILCFIFYTLFCLGIYAFLRRFIDSKIAGLAGGVMWAVTHVNVISFQGHYWETTRLFGSAAVPWVLNFADRAITRGEKRDILATIFLTAYTFLSSMLSVFDLIIVLFPFILIRGFVFIPESPDFLNQIRSNTISSLKIGIVGILSLCCWWYIPAMLPFGVTPFFSGHSSYSPEIFQVLFQWNPPSWMPAVQLPITLLGLFGGSLAIYKTDRKGLLLVVLLLLAILTTYMIKLQPVRLILNIGFSLILLAGYSFSCLIELFHRIIGERITWNRRHIETAVYIISIIIISSIVSMYLPRYSNYVTVDNSYKSTDEYLTATWLKDNVNKSYFVYVMYGNSFRGAQWLNTFYPEVQQVLGGFDQGARATGNNRSFEFDNIIKGSLNSTETYQQCREYHVKYVVVDRTWLQGSTSHAYDKFSNNNYFRPIETLNQMLTHAEVFEVLDAMPLTETDVEYEYWNIWRKLGVLCSTLFCFMFLRLGARARNEHK